MQTQSLIELKAKLQGLSFAEIMDIGLESLKNPPFPITEKYYSRIESEIGFDLSELRLKKPSELKFEIGFDIAVAIKIFQLEKSSIYFIFNKYARIDRYEESNYCDYYYSVELRTIISAYSNENEIINFFCTFCNGLNSLLHGETNYYNSCAREIYIAEYNNDKFWELKPKFHYRHIIDVSEFKVKIGVYKEIVNYVNYSPEIENNQEIRIIKYLQSLNFNEILNILLESSKYSTVISNIYDEKRDLGLLNNRKTDILLFDISIYTTLYSKVTKFDKQLIINALYRLRNSSYGKNITLNLIFG